MSLIFTKCLFHPQKMIFVDFVGEFSRILNAHWSLNRIPEYPLESMVLDYLPTYTLEKQIPNVSINGLTKKGKSTVNHRFSHEV